MSILEDLFVSPELYPLKVDFQRRSVTFVRMTRSAYESCLFASFAAARRLGTEVCEVRLDDVLLAAANTPHTVKRTHYILHSAYCCSTLLARYFELAPSCFVLREPPLLAQLATIEPASREEWHETLDLSIKLLTRTFGGDDLVVIKTHVPCNIIGNQLLEQNNQATLTFLMTSMRSFLLGVLKLDTRCQRVRLWNRIVRRAAARCSSLADIDPEQLDNAKAAAYWWMTTRFLQSELRSGAARARVSVMDGEQLAQSPRETLPPVMNSCGLSLDEDTLQHMLEHPFIQQHSKRPARVYDASEHHQEMAELQDRFGREVNGAIEWAASHTMTDLEGQ